MTAPQYVPGISINGRRVTRAEYDSGAWLQALLGSAATQGTPGSPDVAPPPVTPQPVDTALENAKLGANWNAGLAGAEAGWQRDQTAWGTGYNADGSRNSSNPYSQAQLMQDEYKRGVTGTNNNYAAQGQLYSGARLNAQAGNDRRYAEGSSGLRDRAQGAYHGIGYGQLSAYGSNAAGVSGEDYGALKRQVYGG